MNKYLSAILAIAMMGSPALAQDAADVTPAAESTPAITTEVTTPTVTDESAAAPAPEEAPARLSATIRSVKGIVQYRINDQEPWQKVEVDQVLDVGVEFRTGPRSSVTFHVPPDQLITLDRLGTLTLLDAIKSEDNSSATTELGMPYGRTRYQVEGAQGVEHRATIRSPSATLAIRGTDDVTFTDQRPGPASASSRGTRVYLRPRNSPVQLVFGSNKDLALQNIDATDTSAGDYRNKKRVVDPGAKQARNGSESSVLKEFELYSGTALKNQGLLKVKTQATPIMPADTGCGCGVPE